MEPWHAHDDAGTGVRRGLEAEGFSVDVAHDGVDGLWRARETVYDAIVLDLMMPGLSGSALCRTLRDEGDWTPVLMLTAKDGDRDQIEGLDAEAGVVKGPNHGRDRRRPALHLDQHGPVLARQRRADAGDDPLRPFRSIFA